MTIYRLRDFAGVFAFCALCALASVLGSPRAKFAFPPAWFDLARTIARSGPLDWRGKAPAGLADAALPNEADDFDAELAELPQKPAATDRATGASLAPAPNPAAPPLEAPAAPAPLSRAAQLYRAGDSAGLLALAGAASDPVQRVGLEWASLRVDAHPGDLALSKFAAAHPRWPGVGWIASMEEADLAVHPPVAKVLAARFAADPPTTPAGKLAEARNERALGREAEAERIIRALWREDDFDPWTEGAILKDFASGLSKADHKYRADRLAYAETFAPALRAAALVGADEVALIQARALASRGAPPANLAIAAPASLQSDPGYLFARLQDARRSERTLEAVGLLEQAPADAATLIDPDKWWSERRMVARQLLDQQYPWLAYIVCAATVAPRDPALKVDAAFHAGWIALRFLDDAPKAARHFADAAAAAVTPLAIARAAYWQGRAAEALGDAEKAKAFYTRAAEQPIAYYGQLAAHRLGVDQPALRRAPAAATGEARDEGVKVAEFLYASGLDTLANSLAFEAARRWNEGAQIAAMADVLARFGDPVTEVEFGKIATIRGFTFDATAFPLRGVPSFVPLAHSADRANIYAVVRQESEFLWRAASGAGAKGLMQILPSTAADTARRAGIAFDFARLIADPAFNTQLGAAFLGRLIEDEGGSEEVAFAAYNAGAGRVAQWLAQYGDPRNGTADPIDWVERIPFDETRDYVERVSENLSVYRARFANAPPPPPPSVRMARE